MLLSTVASAEEAGGGAAGPGIDRLVAQANEAQRAFNIPAQPLATALNAFGRQAGIQVSVDAAVARGVYAQGVVER